MAKAVDPLEVISQASPRRDVTGTMRELTA